VDRSFGARGGLLRPAPEAPARQIWLLQRSEGRPGARLNKTTGWVHRATLKAKQVQMLGGVQYVRFDDEGLHVLLEGQAQVLPVDNVVVCAGQEPNGELTQAMRQSGRNPHVIGGADVAAELDAKRAIAQGTQLAMSL
jgi:2,4-dienoyl-CoA reductase (NADPH2)